jgi:hypothetical protein
VIRAAVLASSMNIARASGSSSSTSRSALTATSCWKSRAPWSLAAQIAAIPPSAAWKSSS